MRENNKLPLKLKFFINLLLFSVLLFGCFLVYLNLQLRSKIKEDTYILVKSGDGINKIVNKLDDVKIVKNKLILKILMFYKARNKTIRYGEYFFEKDSTLNDAIDKLVNNKVYFRTITFAEGLSVNSIVKILENNENLIGDVPSNIPEGSLLPETYSYQKGDTRESVIKQMQKAMNNALNEYWENRDKNLPFSTKVEALILASIVEKETGIASERPLVASVFVNRLKINMPLQSDPTAIYGYTFGDVSKEKDKKTSELIKEESVYNTYKIKKLPPTPICNPGKEAIKAVLNPARTSYIFFVATGNGGHNFSDNYKEHRKFVNDYRNAKHSKNSKK